MSADVCHSGTNFLNSARDRLNYLDHHPSLHASEWLDIPMIKYHTHNLHDEIRKNVQVKIYSLRRNQRHEPWFWSVEAHKKGVGMV